MQKMYQRLYVDSSIYKLHFVVAPPPPIPSRSHIPLSTPVQQPGQGRRLVSIFIRCSRQLVVYMIVKCRQLLDLTFGLNFEQAILYFTTSFLCVRT